METQNVEIFKGDWQDVITLGSLTLEENKTYTVSITGSNYSQVCIASTKPASDFIGHPVAEETSFNFTYEGDSIWVKLSPLSATKATVVIS